jgi:hypothetical protein
MPQVYDLSAEYTSAAAPVAPMPKQRKDEGLVESAIDLAGGMLATAQGAVPWAEEIVAGIRAPIGYLHAKARGEDTTLYGEYRKGVLAARAIERQFRDENPKAGIAATLAGGLATAPVAPLRIGKGVKGVAAAGAVEGAIYGSGEGDDIEERLTNAGIGAGAGLVLGAGLGKVSQVVTRRREAKAVAKASEVEAAEKAAAARIVEREAAAAGPDAAPRTDVEGQGVLPGMEDILTNGQVIARARQEAVLMTPEQAQKVLDTAEIYDPAVAAADLNANLIRFNWKEADTAESAQSLIGAVQGVFAELYSKFPGRGDAARILRTLADEVGEDFGALSDYHAATENLVPYATAARTVLGGHASHLVQLAEKFEAGIRDAGSDATIALAEDLWRAIDRQAMLQAIVGGASSNVARTLRSFQDAARAGAGGQHEAIREALRRGAQIGVGDTAEAATMRGLENLKGDTNKLAQLIIKSKGDVTKLNKLAERLLTPGGRISSIAREAVGNMFSPTTGLVNLVSSGIHLAMRGTRLATSAGISRLTGEAQAAAINGAAAKAYAQGAISGLRTGLSRALWSLEGGLSTEALRVADTFDPLRQSRFSKVLDSARKNALLKFKSVDGNLTEFLRRDIDRAPAIIVNPTQITNLQARYDELGGPLGMALSVLTRGGAFAINTAGAVTRTATEVFIKAPDQLVAGLAREAGRRARAAELSMAEGLERGLTGDELATYLQKREASLLTQDADASDTHAVTAAAGIEEGRIVTFQEEMTGGWRSLSNGLYAADRLGIVFPFVQTPLNILRRSVIDYTPLRFLRDEARKELMSGDAAVRDRAMADLALGSIGLGTAFALADQGLIKGPDGGFASLARIDGSQSYSIEIGGVSVEFNRLDPIGFHLGFAGAVSEALEVAGEFDDVNQDDLIEKGLAMFSAGASAMLGYTLNKTFLTGLQDLTEMAQAAANGEWDRASAEGDKIIGSFAERFVPGAASQRYLDKLWTGQTAVAASFSDRMARDLLGFDDTPSVDWLGEIKQAGWFERGTGFRVKELSEDPLRQKLAEEDFIRRLPARSQDGVKLTSAQYLRFVQLQRFETVDPNSGLTFREALEDYALGGQWDADNSTLRGEKLTALTGRYTRLAKEALSMEDADFAQKQAAAKAGIDLRRAGASDEEAAAAIEQMMATPTTTLSDADIATLTGVLVEE